MAARKRWTVKEVAEFLDVDESYVYRHIPALQLPGRIKRFDPDAIERLGVLPNCSLKTKEKAKPRGHKPKLLRSIKPQAIEEDLWS